MEINFIYMCYLQCRGVNMFDIDSVFMSRSFLFALLECERKYELVS